VRSSNPAFATGAFQQSAYAAPGTMTMTVQGTVSKTFLLLAILSGTALWSWSEAESRGITPGLLGGAAIGGLIVALITCFRPTLAPWTAPVYAALEGVFLGALSQIINIRYPGIAIQAVALTSATMLIMLTLYATRVIQVTQKLYMGIVAATGAVFLVYLVTWLLQAVFHVDFPYLAINGSGKFGILFSLFVVGLAAFNLLLDFDMIEQGASYGAPKSMEWYGAFSLMVTLIWLYVELLNLLRKIYSDRR
jgi:uncharacterized YccA/Bax inhibitor family protein